MSEPTWEIARLFPDQGCWPEEDYLALDTKRLVEFVDGTVEVLPTPSPLHQLLVRRIFGLLLAFEMRRGGQVLFSPLRVRLRPGLFREPDVAYMRPEHRSRRRADYWDGAELVVEVVSPGGEARDRVKKRADYAAAGVSEYWIVDPQQHSVEVLRLRGDVYARHAYGEGEGEGEGTLTAATLDGVSIDLAGLFAAEEEGAE